MFFLKNLPTMFYQAAILGVIVLEIVAPMIIMYSLQTNMYNDLAYYSSVGLAVFTVLTSHLFIISLLLVENIMLS